MQKRTESDNSPDMTPAFDSPEREAVQRRIWIARIVGVAAALASLVVILIRQASAPLDYILDIAMFSVIIAIALVAARKTRLEVLRLERKLQQRLAAHNVELKNIAEHDDLTQLFNRRYFFHRLDAELQSARELDRPLAVIMMDVDSLKTINDSCGHGAGDQALANFGRLFLDCRRSGDTPARIGGDEFAIILPATDKRGAHTMVKRFRRRLHDLVVEDSGVHLKLTASFGVSGYPWGGDTVDAVMRHADVSMYASKRAQQKRAAMARDDGSDIRITAIPASFKRDDESASTASIANVEDPLLRLV